MKSTLPLALAMILCSGLQAETTPAPGVQDAQPSLDGLDLPPMQSALPGADPDQLHRQDPPPPPSAALDIPIVPVHTTVTGGDAVIDDFGSFNDYRFGLSLMSTSFQLSQGGGGAAASNSFSSSDGISLGWVGCPGMKRNGGVLFGIDGSYLYGRSAPIATNQAFSYQSWNLDLEIGYGIPLTYHVQCEILPFIGAGIAAATTSSNGQQLHSYGGGQFEYGAHLDVVYTFDGGLQLGGTLGLMGYIGSISETGGGSLTVSGTPFQYGVFMGWRF